MKKKTVWKFCGCFLLTLTLVFTCVSPLFGDAAARQVMTYSFEDTEFSYVATDLTSAAVPFTKEDLKTLKVTPGGMAFGTKYRTEGLTVAGFPERDWQGESPAVLGGIKPKDVILAVNGEELQSAARLTELVEASGGKPLYFLCSRNGKKFTAKVIPKRSASSGKYQAGVLVRESGAGIGTVTFLLSDGGFAGLGHGICDGDTGALVPILSGSVMNVKIQGAQKGVSGEPGELQGVFEAGVVGRLSGNSSCGVWGVYDKLPKAVSRPVSVGLREELVEGDATILCTVNEGGIQAYSVKISSIRRDATGSKCFTVTVTDPELIEATGGIVQGMSGSPILQNGKLVGAVTHVLINEPTVGYGIFIENMLTCLPLSTEQVA